ncbi:MAG TPA: hypothetical protein VKT81_24000 [Bryobacteraceae bacterium]|nr:hypothetical protein [Bryobacteraceae bacterium]
MSQETKNTEKTQPTATELSEQELDQVAGGTTPAAKPAVSDIHITKTLDKSSPNLF